MASAIDVAEHILQSNGPMSGKRLQKLVYYSQAWALAWTELPLFFDRIEAWKDGPVVPELYARHRYSAEVKSVQGDPSSLSKRDRDIVDNVLAFYATRSTQWLIDQTHAERPWQDARRGLMPWHSGRQEITRESIREYYGAKQEKKRVV